MFPSVLCVEAKATAMACMPGRESRPRAGCGNPHVRFDEREVETEHGRVREAPRHTKGPDG